MDTHTSRATNLQQLIQLGISLKNCKVFTSVHESLSYGKEEWCVIMNVRGRTENSREKNDLAIPRENCANS